MAHGKHRKKKELNYKPLAVGSAIAVGGVGVLAGAGTASAATVSDWDKVAQCESGGRWNLSYGDRDSTGGLQFRVASWGDALGYLRSHGVDTSSYPSMPYLATKQQQIIAGEALLALQGPGAWTCNGMVGNPLSSGSMFEGGPNPYPAASQPPATPPAPVPVDEPADAEDGVYTVRQGDTLSGIARKLDIRGGWKVLYAINKKVIGPDPNIIEVGQKLRLPGHEAPPEGKTGGTYVVKSGDWLAKIAKAKLGAADKWRAIYDLNKSVIGGNPNLIHPGQKFQMPGNSVAESGQSSAPVAKPKPKPPVSSASVVMPVTGRIGDSLIIGSGGSMSRSAGGHSGLDIMAPQGTPVKSAMAGTVVSMNSSGGAYGLHVVVRHSGGVYTLYAHLSRISVSVGQNVAAGQQVGNVGSTGNSSGAHLHFEVRTHPTAFTSGTFLNPLTWLRSHGISV
jgi:murein DD-endopeptidase MepM/ murein hydrolase activator NlpD